jgi:hypothetical protein
VHNDVQWQLGGCLGAGCPAMFTEQGAARAGLELVGSQLSHDMMAVEAQGRGLPATVSTASLDKQSSTRCTVCAMYVGTYPIPFRAAEADAVSDIVFFWQGTSVSDTTPQYSSGMPGIAAQQHA